jgi:hypothetical protein
VVPKALTTQNRKALQHFKKMERKETKKVVAVATFQIIS